MLNVFLVNKENGNLTPVISLFPVKLRILNRYISVASVDVEHDLGSLKMLDIFVDTSFQCISMMCERSISTACIQTLRTKEQNFMTNMKYLLKWNSCVRNQWKHENNRFLSYFQFRMVDIWCSVNWNDMGL